MRGVLYRIRDRPSLRHPVDRGEPERRTRFDHFAERASYFSSSPAFFFTCVALVAAWALGYAFHAGGTFEQVLTTAIGAMALLLVAMLKNSDSARRPRFKPSSTRWLPRCSLRSAKNSFTRPTGRWSARSRPKMRPDPADRRQVASRTSPPGLGTARSVLPHRQRAAASRSSSENHQRRSPTPRTRPQAVRNRAPQPRAAGCQAAAGTWSIRTRFPAGSRTAQSRAPHGCSAGS